MDMEFVVLLYYKYVEIDNPKELVEKQRALCEKLSLKGRILIANEGINGTVEGRREDIELYIKETEKDKRLKNINWKKSKGTGDAFRKLIVRARPEIVTTGIPSKDFGPLKKVTGKYLSAEDLYKWFLEKREFYIVDMRNDYEYELGRFQSSIWPQGLGHFRDVPRAIETISNLKVKTVVTVCTGGVRCETASGLLIKYGFQDVYQLQHGIVTFMEKYPNMFFEGKLVVFDGRETIGFNTQDPNHKVVGKCRNCAKASENLVNYWNMGVDTYGIICHNCIAQGRVTLSRDYYQNQPQSQT